MTKVPDRAAWMDRTLERCDLCGNRCGADRLSGEVSVCGADRLAEVAWRGLCNHIGPLVAGSGNAAVFRFDRCGLSCLGCRCSGVPGQEPQGLETMTSEALADEIRRLVKAGASAVVLDAATSYLPAVAPALASVREAGLAVPVFYKSAAFESPAALALLDGLVDVYMPDMKFACDDAAAVYAGVRNYVETSRSAVIAMHGQVGSAVFGPAGTLQRGLMVRHTVFPKGRSQTVELLSWITANLPPDTLVVLRCDYAPPREVMEGFFPELDSTLSEEQCEYFRDAARTLGLTNVRMLGPPPAQHPTV